MWPAQSRLQVCAATCRLLPPAGSGSGSNRFSRLMVPASRVLPAMACCIAAVEHAMAGYTNMIWRPIMEASVFRFDISEAARSQAPASFSFSDPAVREQLVGTSSSNSSTSAGDVGSIPAPAYVPRFRLQLLGLQTVELQLPPGTNFYGTGLVASSLERTGHRVVGWNTDAWGYTSITHALYQSHPWVLAVLPDGDVLGVLADTQLKVEIDLRKHDLIRFRAANPYPVITMGPFPDPESLMAVLARAIGTPGMPPKWALGYHQCRWSYKTADRVMEIATTFRDRQLPCDVVWIDIDYMDELRTFTVNRSSFPDPPSLTAALHSRGFHTVWTVDPGVKQERGYPVWESGEARDCWVLENQDQEPMKPFQAIVWPGTCVWPDFTRSSVRSWWAEQIRGFVAANGVDGICADMNEPALFYDMVRTMPSTCLHRGDPELGGNQSHDFYHNVYGGLMSLATHRGMLQARPGKRPFVLSRAGFLGDQAVGWTWTGDNQSRWDHLAMAIPMTLNLALSGQPLAGADIGGFHGNATPKLFARWMGIGALMPLARGHSDSGTKNHEPWEFGEECERVCRMALQRRYRLMPYLYTLAHRAHTTGIPICAPLFFADSRDLRLREVEDAFLLGNILVSASVVLDEVADPASVLLPKGVWRRFDFHDQHPDLPLLHLKGGSIVPTGPVIQHVGEAKDTDTVCLLVALDEHGRAEGSLYEDDGEGLGYLRGDFLLTRYAAQTVQGAVTVSVAGVDGMRARPDRLLAVRLLLEHGHVVGAEGKDGEAIRVQVPAGDGDLDTRVMKLSLGSGQNSTWDGAPHQGRRRLCSVRASG